MDIQKLISTIKLSSNTTKKLAEVIKKQDNLINKFNGLEDMFLISFLNEFMDFEINNLYRLDNKWSFNDQFYIDTTESQTAFAMLIKNIENNCDKITCDDIIMSHEMFSRYDEKCSPGDFRCTMVRIATRFGENIYIPPEPEKVKDYMNEFVEYFNSKNQKAEDHPFIKSAILHYLMVWIHPFSNGNGRSAALMQQAYLGKELNKAKKLKYKMPIVFLSDAFDFERVEYNTIENKIHNDLYNDESWNEWFMFHLSIIEKHFERMDFLSEKVLPKYKSLSLY